MFPIYNVLAVLEMGPKSVYDNAVGYRPSPDILSVCLSLTDTPEAAASE